MEVALDYALQCSPDHPWVRDHPEWFQRRPDGSIRYAENPPKKYQDIHPIEFWPEREADRVALWSACRDVLEHWIGHGVKVFRVDNPHTKPFAFWEWVIGDIRSRHPEVLFLAEAFTRPKVMHTLAVARLHPELHVLHVAHAGVGAARVRRGARPGPGRRLLPAQLLAQHARHPRRAAAQRAAVGVPHAGDARRHHEPELGRVLRLRAVRERAARATPTRSTANSEKYEIKQRDWGTGASRRPQSTCVDRQLNAARRLHPALRELRTLRFHGSTDDEHLLVYSKTAPDGSDPVLVVVNLDPGADPRGAARTSTSAPSGSPAPSPTSCRDELTGAPTRGRAATPYVRSTPPPGPRRHVLAVGA